METSEKTKPKVKCPFPDCDQLFSSVKRANEHAIYRVCNSKMVIGKSTEERKDLVNKIRSEEIKRQPQKFPSKRYIDCPCGVTIRKDYMSTHVKSEIHTEWKDSVRRSVAINLLKKGLAIAHAKEILNDMIDHAVETALSNPPEGTPEETYFKIVQKLEEFKSLRNWGTEANIKLLYTVSGDIDKLESYLKGANIFLWSDKEDFEIQHDTSNPDYKRILAEVGEAGIKRRLDFLKVAKGYREGLLKAYEKFKRMEEPEDQQEDEKESSSIIIAESSEDEKEQSEEIKVPQQTSSNKLIKLASGKLVTREEFSQMYDNYGKQFAILAKHSASEVEQERKERLEERRKHPPPKYDLYADCCENLSKEELKEMFDVLDLPFCKNYTPEQEHALERSYADITRTHARKRGEKSVTNRRAYKKIKADIDEKAKEWKEEDKKWNE